MIWPRRKALAHRELDLIAISLTFAIFTPAVWSQNTQRASFYVGSNQHIYHFWGSPGTSWAAEDIMGATGAPLVATGSPIAAFENTLGPYRDAFYLAANQHVYHVWSTPGQPWGVEDLTGSTTGASLAKAGSPLAAFEDDSYNLREVFFLGVNQHVYHFWSSPGSPWGIEDITASVGGAALAATTSPLTAFEDSGHNLREVFYLGTNQHLYHFWSSPGSPWGTEDLTGSTSGSALVAANSPLAAFEDDYYDFREVFYLGTNQHIYHFWAAPGNPWGVEDLTGSTAGAPLAMANSPLAAFEDSLHNLREVFYLGTNQHIDHFWSVPGSPWGVEDLTASTGGSPSAAANSKLAAFENNLSDMREVFYLAGNLHQFHFWGSPGSPWGIEDMTASTAGVPAAISGGPLAAFAEAGLPELISGRVTAGGAGVAGATIRLTGSKTATITTHGNGVYSIQVPTAGTYTVTPSASGYISNPSSRR